MGGVRYTDAERRFFAENYPLMSGPKAFATAFSEAFGRKISPCAAMRYASRKMMIEIPSTHYSPKEIASLCDVSPDLIRKLIHSGDVIFTRFCGGKIGIPTKEANRLIREYSFNPGWPAVLADDASKKIGYGKCQGAIHRAYYRGSIPGYLFKNRVYIPVAYVEAAEEYLRETRGVRVPWSKLQVKGFENWRQSA